MTAGTTKSMITISLRLGKLLAILLIGIIKTPFHILGVLGQMFVGLGDYSSGGRSDYNIGNPQPIVRPESYRTMKRRNRMMCKFDHKKDEAE